MTIDADFWPSAAAFLDLSGVRAISDGKAHCTGVALCGGDGRPARIFHQGEPAYFFYEFEVIDEIEIPGGGLEFHDATGLLIHGKNTFQDGTPAPRSVDRGRRVRCRQVIHLEVAPGTYDFTVGLSSTDEASYRGYREGRLAHGEFDRNIREHCRVVDAGRFEVGFDRSGRLLHHGLANLRGECQLGIAEPASVLPTPAAGAFNREAGIPSVVHVTHWKAGSQWIHAILRDCAPDRVVTPQLGNVEFLNWPVETGKVYPTVYITKRQFDSARVPAGTRRFVVVRDLRDTLVSGYFSLKVSHPVVEPGVPQFRSMLAGLSIEDGMVYLMDEWLIHSARIQLSWLEAGEPLIRYEDLPVSRERLREAVERNRFERLTQGRSRGQEEVAAHERKGIAGDWRSHFSSALKRAFKARYGGHLVATGYEKDLTW